MNNKIKTVYDFKTFEGICEKIDAWAEKFGFNENMLSKDLGCDDLTYYLKSGDDVLETVLTINILDNIVHMETWTMGSVEKNLKSKSAIENLLKKLGQINSE